MENYKDLESLKRDLVEAMTICCMLQFERNLIRSMRKETLDPIITQTINEIGSIADHFIEDAFGKHNTPLFVKAIIERVIIEVQNDIQKKFVNNVYKLYAENEDIITLAKQFYTSNQK